MSLDDWLLGAIIWDDMNERETKRRMQALSQEAFNAFSPAAQLQIYEQLGKDAPAWMQKRFPEVQLQTGDVSATMGAVSTTPQVETEPIANPWALSLALLYLTTAIMIRLLAAPFLFIGKLGEGISQLLVENAQKLNGKGEEANDSGRASQNPTDPHEPTNDHL